jgi:hypothetical protein
LTYFFIVLFFIKFNNYFLNNKKGFVGSDTFGNCVQCSSEPLDFEEDEVVRSSPELSDRVCTEVLTMEESSNQSLLSELITEGSGKFVSGVSRSLSCWYTNATSLNTEKLSEIRAECININYDIRFVSETWFNDQSVVNIDGYKCFRRDRKSKKGGGVCIYTRNSDSFSFRDTNHEQLNSSSIEQVWCVADTGKESILLGCMYRPKIIRNNREEIASINEHRERDWEINRSIIFANELVKKGTYQGLIIAGDFNYAELTWNEELEPLVIIETESSNCFLETLNDCFLSQNVFFETFQQDTSRLTNLLDLVITESKERVYEMKPGPVLGVSDQGQGHLCLTWKYSLKEACSNFEDRYRITRFNYKKGNYDEMSGFFSKINWVEFFGEENVGLCYKKFLELYDNVCEKFVPKIRSDNKRKTRPRWLSRELRAMIRVKSDLWHAFVSSGRKSEEINNKYKQQSKLVRSSISSSISKFEFELAKNSVKNPRGLFSYINNRQNVKEIIRSLNNSSGISTTDKSEMAEILKEQFESVFSRDDGSEPIFQTRTDHVCCDEDLISKGDIINRLNNLDSDKSAGVDKVTQHVLKNCSTQISGALEIIFNKSIIEGETPDEWREANVTPIFKKGSKLDASNYRPVSLTSVCCKIMEGILRERITSHLTQHKLISPSQHGFVKKKACVTNLLECQNVVSRLLNEDKVVDVLYTDFEKAFDKVSHKKLLIKLYAYGIRGKLMGWIKSFLRGRRQRVVMGEIKSEWGDILSGVPQGSVLGPLLFVIYINDLPDGLENIFKMYADDSKVIAEAGGLGGDSKLQRDIVKIKEWCDKWSMSLNSSKCKVMHFGKKNPGRNYYVDNGNERVILGVTEAEKDLGIIIANNCKNNLQAEKSINRANYELGRMRKTFQFFNIKLFRILYPTFIRPHLEFASAVWNKLSKEHKFKMESIQRKATKMVIEIRSLQYEDRLRALGLTTLEERRKRGDLIQIYKIINGIEEVDMDMGVGKNLRVMGGGAISRDHGYQIEREKPGGKNPMRYYSLPNRNNNTWNILPPEIVGAETVNLFKERIDGHMRSAAWRQSIYRV